MNRVGSRGFTLLGTLLLLAAPAGAQQFNGGIPAGWACTGTCATLGADGVVTLAPGGGTAYGYVTTAGGPSGGGQLSIGGTNGSSLLSQLFAANALDILAFSFNYVTSDGAGFADYAWARLLDESLNEVALLFTARTVPPPGNIVPGAGLPDPEATLDPATVPINAGTTWSPLASWSGLCFSAGCGHSGWVASTYQIAVAGNFYLEFGVTNWIDTIWDSGLAFDGLKIGDVVIGVPPDGSTVPEPGTISLMALGLVGIAGARFWRRRRA